MLKQKITILIFLFSLLQVINGQDSVTTVLDCDVFFKEVYENGKSKLFDLRGSEEFNKERLVDAILVDTKEKFLVYLNDIDKNTKIFLYCEKGKRSIECSQWLRDLGYTNVFQLKGGFINWKKSGFPIDSEKVKQ